MHGYCIVREEKEYGCPYISTSPIASEMTRQIRMYIKSHTWLPFCIKVKLLALTYIRDCYWSNVYINIDSISTFFFLTFCNNPQNSRTQDKKRIPLADIAVFKIKENGNCVDFPPFLKIKYHSYSSSSADIFSCYLVIQSHLSGMNSSR